MRSGFCRLSALLVGVLCAGSLWAAEMVLIIDDLGYNQERDTRALLLPGPVALSILPFTPYGRELAAFAHEEHKPVMLHLPMQPHGFTSKSPGSLNETMARERFLQSLRRSLAAIPHLQGVNNHQGSALTTLNRPMGWLMEELQRQQLFFVDSRTSAQSVAEQVALERGVPTARRDVFLDHTQTPEFIDQQFQQALRMAKRDGRVVVIGHPYPETLDYLEQQLPQLAAQGVRLVAPQQLVNTPIKLAGKSEDAIDQPLAELF